MDFPTIEQWKLLLAPGDEKFGLPDLYDYYRGKYEIAKEISPKSICEIGVRYGYSAFAFLFAAPTARYVGFDLISGGHGGVKADTFAFVSDVLCRHFPQALIRLIHADTRQLTSLGNDFDFIHIDGNHGESACYHDLALAMEACKPGGTILVDDYDYVAGVKRATGRFVHDLSDAIDYCYGRKSLRGEFIIRKRKGKTNANQS